ncbi:MAG: hypothetical protein ACFFD1_08515 [Candidatus Thorarchaeota archaeon]
MNDIDKFIGEWKNEAGNRLIIKKYSNKLALVSFYSGIDNKAVLKPYDNNNPTTQMYATLADYGSSINVDLWQKGKRFYLNLYHHYSYDLDKLYREALSPSINRNSKDDFLDKYFSLFFPLDHYVRINDE